MSGRVSNTSRYESAVATLQRRQGEMSEAQLRSAATVPSFFCARLWVPPPAMATTPWRPAGTSVCPQSFAPHATTVPSDFTARL